MATSDFRFRVSKAVGSPAVQGAGSVETLANHTENPHPHPQYMRKSYVGLDVGLTEHLANRLHHARYYALRDELTTTKLEYERYKLISLSKDSSNYMAESGVKAHVITAFVLNQILQDVGLDGSEEALTYNNLINSYDTKVSDASRFAPTWEMFLKLKRSIGDWMLNGTPNDYVLKETWLAWIRYMYGDTDSDEITHPLRAGLKVALYSTDRNYESFDRPDTFNSDPILYAGITDKMFIPSLSKDTFTNAAHYFKATSDVTPVAGKEYIYVVDHVSVQFTGSTFSSGTTYYEKVPVDLKKIQGDALTCGCGILEKNCKRIDQCYFDWYNGQEWNFYAGQLGHGDQDPHAILMMVWEGRIRLGLGQSIKFAGVADDLVFVKIGGTVVTKVSNNNYWQNLGDHQNEESYSDCQVYSYTASSAGLYTFTIAVVNRQTVGPRSGVERDNNTWTVPFRMSLDGGTTWVPISNESLENPIFFLPDNSEKDYRKTADDRDKFNYSPKRMPGLLIRAWQSAAVESSSEISGNTYPIESAHNANVKRLHWSTSSFYGDKTPLDVDRVWSTNQGPMITNGCALLAKDAHVNDQDFFDWYNATSWKLWAGNASDSINDPWRRRMFGWFGSIFMRKGETVKFHGRVDDHWWVKIDDTWVVDMEHYASYAEGESPVHTYTSTYTGYHPFKLLARNVNTVGLKPALSSDYPKIAFNNDTYMNIMNESFAEPRFFLPDDCDAQYFWNQGIELRDKRPNMQNVIDQVYPIGSVYICMDGVNQPFPGSGTTWTLIGKGKTLWGYDPDAETVVATGTVKEAELPNIKGTITSASSQGGSDYVEPLMLAKANGYGAFAGGISQKHFDSGWASQGGDGTSKIVFDASKSSSTYKENATVQPPAIVVAFWQRTS